MLAGISVTTRVTKPDVVPSTSSNKSRCYIGIIHYPSVSRVKYTVLEENSWLPGGGIANQARNTVLGQDVAILSSYAMLLILEAILGAEFLKAELSVASVVSSELSSRKACNSSQNKFHI